MNAAVRTQLRFLLCDTIGESDLIYTTLTLTSAWNKINDHTELHTIRLARYQPLNSPPSFSASYRITPDPWQPR